MNPNSTTGQSKSGTVAPQERQPGEVGVFSAGERSRDLVHKATLPEGIRAPAIQGQPGTPGSQTQRAGETARPRARQRPCVPVREKPRQNQQKEHSADKLTPLLDPLPEPPSAEPRQKKFPEGLAQSGTHVYTYISACEERAARSLKTE